MAEYKNIILVALRDFEFSHGLGPLQTLGSTVIVSKW